MPKRAILLFLLSTCCIPALCQGLPVGSPDSVGLSAQRLERIGAGLQKKIDEGPTGGLNLDQIFEALAYQSIAD